ncbi:MAG: hypothetical protein ACE5FH_04980 [Candidatus Zixiibacteriota bacterium]
MISTERNRLIIFFLAVFVRLAFFSLTQFTADDAFITYRYAENIAFGNGFIYNTGEHVLGTSTPLFTLILSIFRLFSLPAVNSSLLVSLIASGFTAVVLYRFGQSLRFGLLSYIPALIYILWPRSLAADTCGMETALFTLFVTGAVYYSHKHLGFYAVALATLASATRPEGLWMLLLVLVAAIAQDRFRAGWYLLIPAVIIGPWVIFAIYYFGSPIPHSIPAKLALYSRFGTMSVWENMRFLMAWHRPEGWIMFAAAITGGVWLFRKQDFGRVAVLWIVGLVLFFGLGRTHLFFWYAAPIYPLYILLASAAIVWGIQRFVPQASRRGTVSKIASGLIVIVLIGGCYPSVRYYRALANTMRTVHKQIGEYLGSHSEDTDRVAAEDIGYIGYYSGLYILDRDGLVSPAAIPYNREGRYLALILDHSPQWVVLAVGSPVSLFRQSDRFHECYQLQKQFKSSTGETYEVYRLGG